MLALETRRLEKEEAFCVFGSFGFEVAPPVFVFWFVDWKFQLRKLEIWVSSSHGCGS